MRLTTYSVSKSMLNGVAMMRLGQLYGPTVYSQLIRDYVPQYTAGGDWSNVTFDNTIGLATGNYLSASGSDESSPQEVAFFNAEEYAPTINEAFIAFPSQAPPGTVFVYHSSDAFIVNQAMNACNSNREAAPTSSTWFAAMSLRPFISARASIRSAPITAQLESRWDMPACSSFRMTSPRSTSC
jgi:hypothetical protein